MDRIERHRIALEERMDPEFGLVDKLYANSTLSRNERDCINRPMNTTDAKNKMLLDYILKKEEADVLHLQTALIDTGQMHLVNYLNADGEYNREFGDVWPLREREMKMMRTNNDVLIDHLNISCELCAELFARGVINQRQRNSILSANKDDVEKTKILLDILERGSLRQYQMTIRCLCLTKQEHIAEILSGGAVVRLHANLEGVLGFGVDTNVAEVEITRVMSNLLDGKSSEETSRIREAVDEIVMSSANLSHEEISHLLELIKLRLIAVRKGESIVLYICCNTLEELIFLYDLLTTGHLKVIVQKIFNQFQPIIGTIALTWSEEEYSRQKAHLLRCGQTGVKDLQETKSDETELDVQKAKISAVDDTSKEGTEGGAEESVEKKCKEMLLDIVKLPDKSDYEVSKEFVRHKEKKIDECYVEYEENKYDECYVEYEEKKYDEIYVREYKPIEHKPIEIIAYASAAADNNDHDDEGYVKFVISDKGYVEHRDIDIHLAHKIVKIAAADHVNTFGDSLKTDVKGEEDIFYFLRSLTDLPFELLDVILLKACLLSMLPPGQESVRKRKDAEIIRAVAQVNECFCQRLLRRRFKRRIMRHLAAFYRRVFVRSRCIRNNSKLLLATIKNKALFNRSRSGDCLTDKETRFINAQTNDRDKNEELLNAVRSLNARRYNGFIYCLLETRQDDDVVKVAELGREGLIDYNPILIETIAAEEELPRRKAIFGMTVLDGELFILSRFNPYVEVFDATYFSPSRSWMFKELIVPWDISSAGSGRERCLYVVDKKLKGESSEILKFNPDGKLLHRWFTGDNYGRVSITDESNVLLIGHHRNKLIEYSPDGQLICQIELSSESKILHPWHAVKLVNGHFVVCHGSVEDPLHRVCEVDVDGNLIKSFGGNAGSGDGLLNGPVYMSVDETGSILVADQLNRRVLVLNLDLEFKREILTPEKHGLENLVSIFLDQSTGRLFAVDNVYDVEKRMWMGGRVSSFDIREITPVEGSIGYRKDPVFIETLRTKEERRKCDLIVGVTVLYDELFIATDESPEVQVYDSTNFGAGPTRSLKLKELIQPLDMGSSSAHKCLYIYDGKFQGLSEILKVDAAGKLIKKWSTEEDRGRLSVAAAETSNVILTLSTENTLIEYSPEGQLVRRIKLRLPSPAEGQIYTEHAIQLTRDLFVVSLGSDVDHMHRVSIVGADGVTIKSFGGEILGSSGGLQLNVPIYLAVDRDGSIMVADRRNRRLMLFSSTLEFKREILSPDGPGLRYRPTNETLSTAKLAQRLRYPSRICLVESRNQLLVADNEWDDENKIFTDGQLLIFSTT